MSFSVNTPRMAICIAKKLSCQDLINRVRERYHFKAWETPKRLGRVDGLEVTRVTIPLTCPLSKKSTLLMLLSV